MENLKDMIKSQFGEDSGSEDQVASVRGSDKFESLFIFRIPVTYSRRLI